MLPQHQIEKARAFASLHMKGHPLILYNIWDAGSAKAVEDTGARALATGSWSLAAAQGFKDGEQIPLDHLLWIIERIATTTALPLSVDFESGYAKDAATLVANITRLMAAGGVGINFEDQVINGALHSIEDQCARIKTIRQTANTAGLPLFINARTDIFLRESDRSKHKDLMEEAFARARAYANAGANGFFTPALVEPALIEELALSCPLPLNIMMMNGAPSVGELTARNVARISYGAGPYFTAVQGIRDAVARILS